MSSAPRMGPSRSLSEAPAEGGVIGVGGQGKIDGMARITGAALYAGDLDLPRLAHCKLLRSPQPHARLLSIDAREALALPGVLGVLVGEDLPQRHGPIPVAQDEPTLAIGKVRYVGEPILALCATSEALAADALERVRVELEPLPAVYTEAQALAPGAPYVQDEARKKSNILREVEQRYGEVEQALAGSRWTLEADYRYPGSTHLPLEPHTALARPEPDGRLTIWTSTQNPHQVHRSLARVLGRPVSSIRLIKPAVGAGYGGKCDTFASDICAAAFALRLGRPVRCEFSREEVFLAHRGRHPTRMRLKMGLDEEGRLQAMDLEAVAMGGAYASYGVVTAYYLGVFGTLPYALAHYRFRSARLLGNLPPCGPKRGHGALQPRFAIEHHLERLARQAGLDSVDLRLRGLVSAGHETVNGLKVTSTALRRCVEEVVERSGLRQKRGGALGPGRGVGLAVSAYMCGAQHPTYATDMPQSGVTVQIDRSGRVLILSGTADIGQGSNQMLASIVAERLGLPPALCTVVEADTDLCPVDLGSYSSRVTFMAGNAALAAVEPLRQRLLSAAARKLGVEEGELLLVGGRCQLRADPGRSIDWAALIELAEAEGGTLCSAGSYRPPPLGSRFRRSSVGPSPAYSFTACVVQLEVEEDTGLVRIEEVWCAHDLGRVLHPEVAIGQVEGCVYMGLGEALYEEQRYEQGRLLASSILDYRVPTAADMPQIHAILVEEPDPEGPFGAKEVGEGPQLAVVPAVANALLDATGEAWPDPPYTPEKVLQALRRARRRPC